MAKLDLQIKSEESHQYLQYPVIIYLLKVNNSRNTRNRCEICSKEQ